MKTTKTGKRILIVLGIIFCLYGLCVLAIIGAGHWFNFCSLLIGIALIAVAFGLGRLKAMPGTIKRIILVVLAIALVVFIVFECRIVSFAHRTPTQNADYVIVLGAKVNGTEPSLEFAVRLKTASDYLKENPGSTVITTGGKGTDEGIAEGQAAKTRLEALGIQGDRIIVEDKSKTTYENLKFAKELIASDDGDVATNSVVIISSSFHLYRASKYAEAVGYQNASYYGRSGLFILVPHYYAREFAAFTFDFFSGRFR